MKSRILTPSTLLLLVHIKAAITGTHGAAIDKNHENVKKLQLNAVFTLLFSPYLLIA